MIEKDNIKELFSNSLENHTVPVRPEVWQGLQAKMAVAGVTSSTVVAAKGLSALTKWIIGSAAVTGTAVITTVAILNSQEEIKPSVKQNAPSTQQPVNSPKVSDSEILISKTQSETGTREMNSTQSPRIFGLPEVFDSVYEPVMTSVDNTAIGEPVSGEQQTIPVFTREEIIEHEKQTPVVIEIPSSAKEETQSEIITTDFQPARVEFFPNVFSPNGDNVNDYYELQFRNTEWIEVTIIDSQKNQPVFKTNDPLFKWDGTINGTDDAAPEGLYACIIQYRDYQGKTHKKTQLVTLER